MTDIDELRIEGLLAVSKNMRIGHYCLEAANEIERLRDEVLSLQSEVQFLRMDDE